MTIADMHQLYKILMNKADTINYPNFEPEEIDVIFNNEQFKIIEQRAYGNNHKKESVEETQKRVDDLRNITLNYTLAITPASVPISTNKPNSVFVALPSDYRHSLEEECTVWYTDCNGDGYAEYLVDLAAAIAAGTPSPGASTTPQKVVPVMPITHDRYNKIIRDPFNKPYEDLILRLPYQGNQFELVGDATLSIISYSMRYLRTPASMRYGTTYATPTTDVQCELAEHLHREIVESAVRSTLENIESVRYNSQNQIIKETE